MSLQHLSPTLLLALTWILLAAVLFAEPIGARALLGKLAMRRRLRRWGLL